MGGGWAGTRINNPITLKHRLDWSKDTHTMYFTNFTKKASSERETQHFTTLLIQSVERIIMEENSRERYVRISKVPQTVQKSQLCQEGSGY